MEIVVEFRQKLLFCSEFVVYLKKMIIFEWIYSLILLYLLHFSIINKKQFEENSIPYKTNGENNFEY